LRWRQLLVPAERGGQRHPTPMASNRRRFGSILPLLATTDVLDPKPFGALEGTNPGVAKKHHHMEVKELGDDNKERALITPRLCSR